MAESKGRRRGRTRNRDADHGPARESARVTHYRRLKNPFPAMNAVSDDRVAAIHDAALGVLENLGIRVLLPEARELLVRGGARPDPDDADGNMLFIGRDMVLAALDSAPASFTCRGAVRDRDLVMQLGNLAFQPGAAAPHATDLLRGRRPGSGRDYRELVQLAQYFDILHMMPPLVEPQDVPIHLRHYFMMQTQLTLSDKFPFIYSRGQPQVMESFAMLQEFRGLSDAEFRASPHCFTIINTNSPRQLDIPMAQGLMDFARMGQLSIVTPFTLMGAMAPITVAGAMTLSHAEAMAAITLTQLVRPGAPVCYGTFTSNVDMKSGSPAFGTPEHFKASLLAGQLARLIGLPWRCASGSAANINDVQAASETQFGMWGCLLAGASVVIHAAGWLEGGLSLSYEKLVTDVEVLQMAAEMCVAADGGDAAIGLDALEEVKPGGHFFAAAHTMARYETEFYQPLVADWSNFGTWTERGARTASERATDIWQHILANPATPEQDGDRVAALEATIAKGTKAGGAAPVS